MTLNGWQRLWLIVVIVWGIAVSAFAAMLWPKRIYHPPNGYSEEVIAEMRIRDWKGKSDCSGPPTDPVPLQVVPDELTVAFVVRQAYPRSYDDLTDPQLEDAVRSKAPELDGIVRRMIAARESVDNIVVVLRHATESNVKGADVIQPVFVRIYVPIDGEKDNEAVLCFSGEPKERAQQITGDYHATYLRVLKSKQRRTAAGALAAWLLPALFTYALGWSVGWIRRGFVKPGMH